MKVKCLIIDDEPLAATLMQEYVSKVTQLETIAVCYNALDAFEIIRSEHIDLIFLDIQMPTLTGIEFLKSLQNPPKVIFTTAYREYALESYELEVVDYLLKPISFNRFFKAIDKYLKNNINTSQILKTATVSQESEHQYIFVNVNKKKHKVLFRDILYAESLKDYVRIHTLEKTLTTKEKISTFEQWLPKSFLRTHRSYIVNLNKISAFTSQDVEIGTIEIPIGISYKKQVLEILNS